MSHYTSMVGWLRNRQMRNPENKNAEALTTYRLS